MRAALFAPLLTYVVLVAAYHPNLRWRLPNRAGDYSYGLYVYAFPIQQTIVQRAGNLEPADALRICVPGDARHGDAVVACARTPCARTKITFRLATDSAMNTPMTLREISCADDYDPNSMPVDKARALIRQFLEPVSATERVHIRAALGRVLAEDMISPSTCRGTTTRRWTAGRCASRTSRTNGETTLEAHRRIVRRQAVTTAPSAPGETRAHLHRRGHAARRRHRRDAGARDGERRSRHASPRAPSRRPGRTGASPARTSSAAPSCSAAASRAARRARHARLARHRRSRASTASCASRSSPPATSCARSARRSPPARSTTATATRSTAC